MSQGSVLNETERTKDTRGARELTERNPGLTGMAPYDAQGAQESAERAQTNTERTGIDRTHMNEHDAPQGVQNPPYGSRESTERTGRNPTISRTRVNRRNVPYVVREWAESTRTN